MSELCQICSKHPATRKHKMGHRPGIIIDVCESCYKDIQSKRPVGRPPTTNRKGTAYLLNFPDQDFIEKLDIIAMREGITRKDLLLKFCREGMERHSPGNPQTLLNSYAEGGVQTLNQLVGRLRQKFYSREEVLKREILMDLKAEGIDGAERIHIANGIAYWLREQGKKVYE